jgi:hypothetical protein
VAPSRTWTAGTGALPTAPRPQAAARATAPQQLVLSRRHQGLPLLGPGVGVRPCLGKNDLFGLLSLGAFFARNISPPIFLHRWKRLKRAEIDSAVVSA